MYLYFLFLFPRPPPRSTLFPYTTLFRSYGARGDMPPVTLTFHQGEHRPAIWLDGGIPQWPSGCLFIGEKGMILSEDRKSTRLNSSHEWISYAVFCLKKKNKKIQEQN